MTDSNKITCISECFSIQPMSFTVGTYFDSKGSVDKIIEEDVYIVGDPFPYYVGYDQNGRRLFEFKKGTVNVIYNKDL